ncbi:MAG: hypothetical protein RLZZ272_1778, partial [Actinomycetota bacterium]
AHAAGVGVVASDAFGVFHRNPTRLRQVLSRSRSYAASAGLRFAPDRALPPGPSDAAVVELARRRPPLPMLVVLAVVRLVEELGRRHRRVRDAGFGRARSWVLLAVHLPWMLSYAWFSLRATRLPPRSH